MSTRVTAYQGACHDPDERPCPTCSNPTRDEDFCAHSRDPLCSGCCGAGEHSVWCGGVSA